GPHTPASGGGSHAATASRAGGRGPPPGPAGGAGSPPRPTPPGPPPPADDRLAPGHEPAEAGDAQEEQRGAREPEAPEPLRAAPEERHREVAEVHRQEVRRDAERPERGPGERVPDRAAEVRPRRVRAVGEEAERQEHAGGAGGARPGLGAGLPPAEGRLPPSRHHVERTRIPPAPPPLARRAAPVYYIRAAIASRAQRAKPLETLAMCCVS